ncbi:MAG: DNA repair protein RecO [Clostridia bacterium]|nr:DNA repair protein RecO [Clostridia bacterium]
MERKTEGIVLKSIDYLENDKLVTLLTSEYGKITVRARGVKKTEAKLRFAAQPFCFAEYVFAEKDGRFTLVSATCHESFFELADPDKLYAAYAVTELACIVAPERSPCKGFFLTLAQTLRNLVNEDVQTSVIRYLLAVCKESGFPLNAERCFSCGGELCGKSYFHFPTGSFSCAACRKGTAASGSTVQLIRRYTGLPFEEVGEDDRKVRAIRLLKEYLAFHLDTDLKCLSAYIRQLLE